MSKYIDNLYLEDRSRAKMYINKYRMLLLMIEFNGYTYPLEHEKIVKERNERGVPTVMEKGEICEPEDKRLEFELWIKECYDWLPTKYKKIIEKFQANPNRWEEYDKWKNASVISQEQIVGVKLPKELNNDEAKEILQRAVKAGLCSDEFKWIKTKALLAYFADLASERLKLGKGEYNGKRKISWKPFELLFEHKNLAGARNDYQKTGTLPHEYDIVDNLFK